MLLDVASPGKEIRSLVSGDGFFLAVCVAAAVVLTAIIALVIILTINKKRKNEE